MQVGKVEQLCKREREKEREMFLEIIFRKSASNLYTFILIIHFIWLQFEISFYLRFYHII